MADTSTRAERALPLTAYSTSHGNAAQVAEHHAASVAGSARRRVANGVGVDRAGARVPRHRHLIRTPRCHQTRGCRRDRTRSRTPEDAHRSGQLTTSADSGQLTSADTVSRVRPNPGRRAPRPGSRSVAQRAAVVAAACPGQCLILTSTSHVGATRDLLIDPLEARIPSWRRHPRVVQPGTDRSGNSYHSGDRVTAFWAATAALGAQC